MSHATRKLRYAMVGGGRDAFIQRKEKYEF